MYKPKDKDKIFQRYYKEVGRTKMLDAQTERALFEQYQKNKDLKARDKIIEGCLRFVVKLASKYAFNTDCAEDLISAGNEGLLVAIDKFDLSRNTRFLSYATSWILLFIRNELTNSNLVAVPLWYQKIVSKLNKERSRSLTATGKLPDDEQLYNRVGVSKAQLSYLVTDCFHYINADEVQLSNSDSRIIAPMRNSGNYNTNKIETYLASNELKDLVNGLLFSRTDGSTTNYSKLSTKESFVVGAYYGFIGQPWSLAEIGSYLSLSSERVRQIKERALKRLRHILEKHCQIKKGDDVC